MSISNEPVLAPPGAGLPFPELLIARVGFRLRRWLTSREKADEAFLTERAAIRNLVERCSPDARARQVLIPRLRGMEDSSRNWSVWMTLDHLRITNDAFTNVIVALCHGQVPLRKASTADVKPSIEQTSDVETAYEASCERFMAAVGAISSLETEVKYAHPWFGPLDGAAWHVLAAMHMGIHRAQIGQIVKSL